MTSSEYVKFTKNIDRDNIRTVNIKEFNIALQQIRIDLREKEVIELFEALDQDRDGEISYDEFLLTIRGPMSEGRRKMVSDSFKFIDRDNSGFVIMTDLLKSFDPSRHPDVERGSRKHDDVYEEFVDGLEAYYRIKGFNDGKVSAEEFLEFYSFVSFAITEDATFSKLVKNCIQPVKQSAKHGRDGRLPSRQNGGSPYVSSSKYEESPMTGGQRGGRDDINAQADRLRSSQVENNKLGDRYSRNGSHLDELRSDIDEKSHKTRTSYDQSPQDNLASPSKKLNSIQALRDQLLKRGPKTFIGLRRQFKIMDDNNDGFISYPEFVKSLKDFGVMMNESDLKSLFSLVDNQGSQRISIDAFCKEYCGQMNEHRSVIVNQVFDKLDIGKCGKVSLAEVKQAFTARGHPDVRSGAKTQDEVLAEFFNTLDTHMNTRSVKKDQRVSRDDFIAYYNYISMFYPKEDEFEAMIRNCWRMPANPAPVQMRRL